MVRSVEADKLFSEHVRASVPPIYRLVLGVEVFRAPTLRLRYSERPFRRFTRNWYLRMHILHVEVLLLNYVCCTLIYQDLALIVYMSFTENGFTTLHRNREETQES